MLSSLHNWLFVAVLVALMCSSGRSQIVLRDLSLLEDRKIVSFDQEKVVLDNGRHLFWHEIQKGDAGERQQEFDRNLEEIGLPIFRLKQRIEIGDWRRVDELASQMMVRYSGVDSPTGALICLASMKGNLETGRRVQAVVPFLLACQKRSRLSQEDLDVFGLTEEEMQLGLTRLLLPVWFDESESQPALKSLESLMAENPEAFPDGGYIYVASLMMTLGKYEQANMMLERVKDLEKSIRQWKQLFLSEIDRRTKIDVNAISKFQVDGSTLPQVEAVSMVFDARFTENVHASTDPPKALLAHLKVVAMWHEKFPSLSAASLYHAFSISKSAELEQEAETLAAELLRRYPSSYHSGLLMTEK